MANNQGPDFDDIPEVSLPKLPVDAIPEHNKNNDQNSPKTNKCFDNPLLHLSSSMTIMNEPQNKETDVKNIGRSNKSLKVSFSLNAKPELITLTPISPKVGSLAITSSTSLFSLSFSPRSKISQNDIPQAISNSEFLKLTASSSNFTSDLSHKLIIKRVLPPYRAPSPPKMFNIKIPIGGYRCLDCFDVFSLANSLSEHLQRRSMKILIDCEYCKKNLTFYNRCSLLEHYRYHKCFKQNLNLDNCIIAPLSQNSITSVSDISKSNSLCINNMSSKDNETLNCKCTECAEIFDNFQDLEDHFRGQISALSGNLCDICQLICPTKCSLSAHHRIHAQQTPCICPECGCIVDEWHVFQHHLLIKCMHFSRTVGYKCSVCFIIYPNMVLLKHHMFDSHSEAYYKCQVCSMVFKTITNFELHKQVHANRTISFKLVFKCPICKKVFDSSDYLHSHSDVHLAQLAKSCLYMFKCLECFALLDNKALLCSHMRTFHTQLSLKEICLTCGSLFQNKRVLNEHYQLLHAEKIDSSKSIPPVLINCEDCSMIFSSPNSLLTHRNNCHLYKCCACYNMFKGAKDLSEHGKRHLEAGLFICLLCSNLVLNLRETLSKHLTTHSEADIGKPCHHCNTTFVNKEEMLNHLKNLHFLAALSCPKCDVKFETEIGRSCHIEIVHKEHKQRLTCWFCKGTDFSELALLKEHINSSHKIPLKEIDFSKLYQNCRKKTPKLPGKKESSKRSAENTLANDSKKLAIDG